MTKSSGLECLATALESKNGMPFGAVFLSTRVTAIKMINNQWIKIVLLGIRRDAIIDLYFMIMRGLGYYNLKRDFWCFGTLET
jgi:hypothetical protein